MWFVDWCSVPALSWAVPMSPGCPPPGWGLDNPRLPDSALPPPGRAPQPPASEDTLAHAVPWQFCTQNGVGWAHAGVQAVGRHLEISSAWAAAVHPAYIWFQSWFLCCCYICHRAFNNVPSDIIYKNWVKWVWNSGHLLKKTWGKLSGKLLWRVKSLLLLCLFVFTRSNTNLLFSQSHLMEEISLWCFITP